MPHKQGFKDLVKEYLPYKSRAITGIEIGCLKGEFCTAMLTEFQGLTMVTIDHMPYLSHLLEASRDVQNRLWILSFPSDIAVKFLNPGYDFLFIDGDHSYEQCKKDILNYAPLIRKGGIIAGHNYHKDPISAHPGVHESVDEIYGDRVRLAPDFIWYVQSE